MNELRIDVRELQARLGEVLRAVVAGGRVVVTSRGRVVAVLSKPDSIELKLRRLAAEGRFRLGRRGPIPPFRARRIGGLSQQVLRDRR